MRAAIESAIVHGVKPVLLVPRSVTAIAGTKVAIGWDGGTASAHAISAAIPLLKRADAIEILTISSGPINTVQLDRLRDYLSLHGLQAIEHGINPGSSGTAVSLIEAAQNASAGLLVMGGYEHSRLREIALGGVTRHILSHATMPVLLAH